MKWLLNKIKTFFFKRIMVDDCIDFSIKSNRSRFIIQSDGLNPTGKQPIFSQVWMQTK